MNQSAARGSSALTDGVRWQMNLVTLTEAERKDYPILPADRGLYLTATITKNNYAAPQPSILLKRGSGGYLDLVELTSNKLAKVSSLNDKIVEIIKSEAKANLLHSKSAFEEQFGGEARPLKVGKNALRTALTELIRSGRLAQDAKHKLIVPGKAYSR